MESFNETIEIFSELIFTQDLLGQVVLHPVLYHHIWYDKNKKLEELSENPGFEDIVDNLMDIFNISKEEAETKLENFVQKTFDDFLFDEKLKKIYVFSMKTGNTDSRGGGCGNYDFTTDDFNVNLTHETGITIRDVIDCCYRLKGSKYDHWYELFHALKCHEYTGETATLEIQFDYGS